MTRLLSPLVCLLALLSGPHPARTATLPVGKNQPFQQIGHALAKAQNGDTILVYPGRYQEGPLVINKEICLIGMGFPVVDGMMKYQPISIRSDRVTISGMKVVRCLYGSLEDFAAIKVYEAREVRIFNNRLEDNFFGIHLSASNHCEIFNNHIRSTARMEQHSGNGIHAWRCDRLSIRDNEISGHRDGIYFEFVTNSEVSGNKSSGNIRYGLHFMFSHKDTYLNNTFEANGAGVAVMYTREVIMQNNRFVLNTGSSAYGLLLKDISGSFIGQNDFIGNTTAIFMEGTSRCQFAENIFRSNGWGIKLHASCENNEFRYNNFITNTFDVSTNSQSVFNSMSNNYWDKYEGYDLDKNGIGDVPYRPVSLFCILADQMPYAMMLWRSFCVYLIDRAEKVMPSLSPDRLMDQNPLMKRYDRYSKHQ